jgi:cell division protein FtsB
MTADRARAPWGLFTTCALAAAIALYFVFAAVQGDFGLFRRAEILGEAEKLRTELASVQSDVLRMENLTRRMSDDFLDLDLLEQQSRDILGLARPDEVILP